jgi:acyl-lipid omega-6 desaturase (Delta-12 desaturase)
MNPRIESTQEARELSWTEVIKRYNHSSLKKSIWQLTSTLFLYVLTTAAMYFGLRISVWIPIALALPAAGFLVRIFIIFHDCGHGSYFLSQKANDTIGLITGILTFTPYYHWHRLHRIHHETAGNLDKRGTGDVWTATLEEWNLMSKWDRLKYRLYRNPITMFGVGSLYMFVINNRFTKKGMDRKGRLNVYLVNVALFVIAIGMASLVGMKAFLLVQLSVMWVAGVLGLWLFYLQHQYDQVYWRKSSDWNYKNVALEGSSYFELPAFFRYFTGNIGFHHVHHLSPMIPNYNLARCHRENKLFSDIRPLTFLRSFRMLTLRLYDEKTKTIKSFREVRVFDH